MPTQEEILLARLAIEKKYLTESRIASVFVEQKNKESQGQTFLLLEHLLSKNLLSKEQAEELQKVLGKRQTEMKTTEIEAVGLSSKNFAHYTIEKELGRGGMGIVYKAFDNKMNRHVALKVLLTGSSASDLEIRRFKKEAESAGSISHPNIVSIYEVGDSNGYPYFTMEFVDGESLDSLIKKKATRKKLLQIVEKVSRAVAYAHEHKIIHRDIKPANILVTPDGEPKITDFGLAKKLDSGTALTQTGASLGTPFYMAPEMITKKEKIDHRVDIYAIGVILYEIVTGRLPFHCSTLVELYQKVVNEEPEPPSKVTAKVDQNIEAITLKAMEKSRESRYQTGNDLADDLDRYLNKKPISITKTLRYTQRLKRLKRYKSQLNVALGMIAGIVLAVTVALFLQKGDEKNTSPIPKNPPSQHQNPNPGQNPSDGNSGQNKQNNPNNPNPGQNPSDGNQANKNDGKVEEPSEVNPKLGKETIDYLVTFTDPVTFIGSGLKIGYKATEYNLAYSKSLGHNWRMVAPGESGIRLQFNVSTTPTKETYFFLDHLSSCGFNLPNQGASPIDIIINQKIVRSGFQPSHPRKEDYFEIRNYLVQGQNNLTVRLCPNASTHYWIFHAEITNKILWLDDFESYTPNSFPSTWIQDKKQKCCVVTKPCTGENSLKVEGAVARPIGIQPPFSIITWLFVEDKGEASVVLFSSDFKTAVPLVTFYKNLTIEGMDKIPLGKYKPDFWHKVFIRFVARPNAHTGKIVYKIGSNFFEDGTKWELLQETVQVPPNISNLTHVGILVKEGAAYLDDIRVKK